MSECNFYTPDDAKPLYGEIVPAYQAAFAGEPWFEVSKCADQLQRCTGGLSSLAAGMYCELCGGCPVLPAYEAEELTNKFDSLAASRPTTWYVEQNGKGVTLAVIAWKANAEVIANEKYGDVSVMAEWLNEELGNDEVMWLDEVFANKDLKPKGNLQNFGKFVTGMAEMLGSQTVAYRTIEPRMIAVPSRDFGQNASIFTRQQKVPDRRDFVVINLSKEQ
jgi:hypothetical protein